MFLAIKEMKKSVGRYLLIFSVITLIAYLAFFLTSLSYGLSWAYRTGIDDWNAHGVVLSDFSNDNIAASSFDEKLVGKISSNKKEAINVTQSVVYHNKKTDDSNKWNVTFFGINFDKALKPQLVSGRLPKNDQECVVSESMKKEQNMKLNDTLEVAQNNKEYSVVGFSKEAKYMTSPILYVRQSALTKSSEISKSAPKKYGNKIKMPIPPKMISAVIVQDEKVPHNLPKGLQYIPIQTFIQKIPGYQAQVLTFALMIGFLVLISAIIIGIFMYILTIQKKNVFGIMKAQGISGRYISNSVLMQTLILSFSGVFVAFSLNFITGKLLPASVPFFMKWSFLTGIGALIILFSLLGTIFSMLSVIKIDPLEAIE